MPRREGKLQLGYKVNKYIFKKKRKEKEMVSGQLIKSLGCNSQKRVIVPLGTLLVPTTTGSV